MSAIESLMNWYGVVKFRIDPEATKAMTHRRMAIPSEEVHQLVADEWVNPTTEYLRGTLGESKAWYYLSIRDERPDEKSVLHLGYQKALARKRILSRLERLRRLTAEI